ncbi:MAG: hypothetical protein GQ477_02425 [Nanohaloarchaea archaeon]|nr:hypothetical protein [Candidatus Nanohaloarchaea archaeon]
MTKFDYQTGISKLPNLVKKSRSTSFIITNEYFLKAILYDGVADSLKNNYDNHTSNLEKIEKIKPLFVKKIIDSFNPAPIVELIFADTDLPQKYKAELENLSENIPMELRIIEGIDCYDDGYFEPPTVHQANFKYDIAFFSVPFKKDDFIATSLEQDEAIISNRFNESKVEQIGFNLVCKELSDNLSAPNNN